MKLLLRASTVLLLTAAALTACGGGGSSNPAPAPVDTSAPDTALSSTPTALTNSSSASFTFTASEAGATFEARTDSGAFAAVTSPRSLTALADGSHTFEVRARDAAGNIDASPASFTWVIDTTPPDTQIISGPSSATVVNAATFAAAPGEAGATLEASVDGAPFAAVTSPYVVTGIADGNHTIQFRARDAAGNIDATPATANWTLDASAPEVRLIFPTSLFYTDAATVSVRGTAQDARGVTALSINGVAAQTSDAFAHWRAVIPVPFGSNPVRITSSDSLGNAREVDAATMVNRGTIVSRPSGIGYDSRRDRVVLLDQSAGAVVTNSRSDGINRLLSPGPGPASGSGLQDVVVDAANDRALIIDTANDTLIAVDLESGVRSVLSPSIGANAPTSIWNAFHLAIDEAGQRVYVSVEPTRSVVRINLATGVRTVVSSPTIGTGDDLVFPLGIVYDAVTNPAAPRLLVVISPPTPQGSTQPSPQVVMAVDLATGNRTPFSTGATAAEHSFHTTHAMVMDAPGQRLLAVHAPDNLVAISLATGERTLINSVGLGSGPRSDFRTNAAFDPVARRLFVPQGFKDIIEVDVVTQARTVIRGSSFGTGNVGWTHLGITLEPGGGATSLLSVEGAFGILSRLNVVTTERNTVSYVDSVGTGTTIKGATDMALDRRAAANSRSALVLVRQPYVFEPPPKLVSVDLTTGNRTLVAGIAVGNYSDPQKMALDVANNRIVFTNDEISPAIADGLYAMDLSTGITSVISDGSHSGPALGNASYVVLEPAGNPTRALVADRSQSRILSVDLATGTRTVFDTLIEGHAGPMLVDAVHSRLLVNIVDAPESLVTVPLRIDGSSRLLITGANPVSGLVRGGGPPQLAVEQFRRGRGQRRCVPVLRRHPVADSRRHALGRPRRHRALNQPVTSQLTHTVRSPGTKRPRARQQTTFHDRRV